MTAINFKCPACNQALSGEISPGVMFRCPKCSAVIEPRISQGILTTQKKRPASFTVLGVLGIGYGAISCFGGLFSLVMMSFLTSKLNEIDFLPEWYIALHPLITGVGIVAVIALIIGSIGLLKCRNWGRITIMAYAWWSIIFGFLSLLLQIILWAKDETSNPHFLQSLIGGVIGLIPVAVASGLVIWILSRPTAKKAVVLTENDLPMEKNTKFI